jgi:hypothetical protein
MADSRNTKEMQVDKNEDKRPEETQQPQLGVLEEDDEFEEFAVQGKPLTRRAFYVSLDLLAC